jgi:hypothetical protein
MSDPAAIDPTVATITSLLGPGAGVGGGGLILLMVLQRDKIRDWWHAGSKSAKPSPQDSTLVVPHRLNGTPLTWADPSVEAATLMLPDLLRDANEIGREQLKHTQSMTADFHDLAAGVRAFGANIDTLCGKVDEIRTSNAERDRTVAAIAADVSETQRNLRVTMAGDR